MNQNLNVFQFLDKSSKKHCNLVFLVRIPFLKSQERKENKTKTKRGLFLRKRETRKDLTKKQSRNVTRYRTGKMRAFSLTHFKHNLCVRDSVCVFVIRSQNKSE
jgi:hypothetical protein